jgi:hypothetical protein
MALEVLQQSRGAPSQQGGGVRLSSCDNKSPRQAVQLLSCYIQVMDGHVHVPNMAG